MGAVRRWWPAVLAVVVSLAIQKVALESRYDVSGHAAEHLSSASAPFFAAAVVFILLWTTPAARRQAVVLVAGAAWLVCTVFIMIGNVRVVDALIDAGMAHTPTSQLVENGSVDSAHDMANLAPWLAVLAVLGLVVIFWRLHHVSGRVAAGAAVASIIVPPWIIPGGGILVLTVARCVAHHRAGRPDPLVAR